MDKLTPEQRRKNMQAVKSTGSLIEQSFAKFLQNAGLNFSKNDKSVFGAPDFVLGRYKIAIFCDGEFWHGKDWDIRKGDHKSNQKFWISKIERNIERDKEVNRFLKENGWTVLRFWGKDIKTYPDECLKQVLRAMKQKEDIKKTDKITISEMYNGGKFKLQFYGPNSLNADGSVMPFNQQMAIISHYLHNQNFVEKKLASRAIGLIQDIYAQKQMNEISVVEESALQYNLFADLFSVPFLPDENPRFTFIDLFAGIGGFRIAMQNLGGKCVFSSEWDEQAQKTYLLNFGEVPFGDITREETKSFIPDNFDILCAGFPCQAFSMAGRRLGFEETRGTLFFDVAEIIKRKQPKAFFLENVKGLLIHDRGKTIETILKVLREDLDYFVPDPKVVNAKDFGLPQHRERIFIVGFRKDQQIFDFEYPAPFDIKRTFADVKEANVVSAKYYLSTQYQKTLIEHKERHKSKGNGFGYEVIPDDGIANAIVVGGMGRERNLIIDNRLIDFTPVTRIKGDVNRDGLRKMTPREWARLQGFPDKFIIGVADASAYKQFGNSVAVPAIQATADKIVEKINLEKVCIGCNK